jgi:hypothetical protein
VDAQELLGFPFRLFFRVAVPFLQLAGEPASLPGDPLQVCFGQGAPLFLHPAREHRPVGLHSITVHHFPPQ